MSMFEVAERRKAKLKLCLEGLAGSGKSHGALLMAQGLVENPSAKTIAALDTENGTLELERGKPGVPDFSVVKMGSPYNPERYIDVINAAVEEGFELLIIDSLTHEWNGPGGILDIVTDLGARIKDTRLCWRKVTPRHDALIHAIIQAPIHIIVTLRTKADRMATKDDYGKAKTQTISTKVEQRDGIDYEFTLVGEVDRDSHKTYFSKNRTDLFEGDIPVRITPDVGRELREWLNQGSEDVTPEMPVETKPATPAPVAEEKKEESKPAEDVVTPAMVDKLTLIAKKAGFGTLELALKKNGVNKDSAELTVEEAKKLAQQLQSKQAA